jgi:PilZ domain
MASTACSAVADQAEYDSDQARLLQAWRHEFLHVAMMSAFVTMGCTAAAGQDNGNGLLAMEANLPDEPAIERAIRHGILAISSRYNPAFFAAQEAYSECSRAVALFKTTKKLANQDSGGALTMIKRLELSKAWRGASRCCLTALQVFDHNGLLRQTPFAEASIEQQCPLRLMQLLRAASAGETLESSGLDNSRDQLPSWVQRRRWQRKDVALACIIESKGGYVTATIRNASLGGALIGGVPLLLRGARLVVTMKDAGKLHASVMWCRDGLAGIKFDEQLDFDHPLLAST